MYLKAETLLCHEILYSQSYGFSVSHVWIWEVDHKETECWRIDAFELWYWRLGVSCMARRSNQSMLEEINSKYSLEGHAEAEAPILQSPDVKNRLIWKDPDVGKDWRLEEKGTTEDEMSGWYHQLNEHEFEQTLGDGEGQGSLACCSPCGCKKSYTTKGLDNNNNTLVVSNAKSCPTLVSPWTVAHRSICPWDFPGKNNTVGCHFLLQGIFLTQESNPALQDCFLLSEPPGKSSNPHFKML